MGFISFNEKYYRNLLANYAQRQLNAEDVYFLKQNLKVLDDLTDEGYTELNSHLEKEFCCLTKLRNMIRDAGDQPFENIRNLHEETTYHSEEHELEFIIQSLISQAEQSNGFLNNSFIPNLISYCEWLGYDQNTAYVFLFRDALLPYIYYKSRGRKNLYPWLISRKFIQDVTGLKDFDDAIRAPIYQALEQGYVAFPEFQEYFTRRCHFLFKNQEKIRSIMLGLLSGIKEEKIIVVESGYCGTFPLMLASLDERVSFRLYTTVPYLYETYAPLIFCRCFEEIRRFETLFSQEKLLRYSSFRDNHFFVNLADSSKILNYALTEIKQVLPK